MCEATLRKEVVHTLDKFSNELVDGGLVRLATTTTGDNADGPRLKRYRVALQEDLRLEIPTTRCAGLSIALAILHSRSSEETSIDVGALGVDLQAVPKWKESEVSYV